MVHSDLIAIRGTQSISNIESELHEIDKQRPKYLLFPTNPKDSALGGEAALIQLIATWSANHPDATLVTHIQATEDPIDQLTKLAKRPSGFSAIWMSNSTTDLEKKRNLRTAAYSCTEPQFETTWHGNKKLLSTRSLFGNEFSYTAPSVTGSGAQVFVACLDHDRWAIPQFYFANEEIRGRDDFIAFARAAVSRATLGSNDSPIPPDLYSAFGAIFHELIKNTHEHARRGHDGAQLRRSIRGVIVNRRAWEPRKAEAITMEAPPLRDFISNIAKQSRDSYIRCIEISIFDSGTGLAKHWLQKKWHETITPQQELQACEDCLQRWASSTDKPHKGAGLHEVATMLTKLRGFMRLRTGRLSLYRNFENAPVQHEDTHPIKLFDWSTQKIDSATAMAPTCGSLFTLLIPVITH